MGAEIFFECANIYYYINDTDMKFKDEKNINFCFVDSGLNMIRF